MVQLLKGKERVQFFTKSKLWDIVQRFGPKYGNILMNDFVADDFREDEAITSKD